MTAYPIKCRITRRRIRGQEDVTRLEVYDDIGRGGWLADGLSAADVTSKLAGVRGRLDVHINSGGGDVFDGLAIYNAIRQHRGPVTVTVDGIAASIASVILQAGRDRVVEPGSMVMVHDAFGAVTGNAAEVTKFAQVLDQVSDNLASVYARAAGGTAAQWRDTMRQETWYGAEDAVGAGLADRVGDGQAALPPGVELAASVPKGIAARLRSLPILAADSDDSDTSDGEDDGEDCPTCHGTGKILEGHRTCPDCHGTGKMTDDGEDDGPQDRRRRRVRNADADGDGGPSCKMCAGNGRLKHPGTGKNSVKCPGCDGTGVYDPDHDGDDDSTATGDTDHDYMPADALRRWVRAAVREGIRAADKYSQDDRDRMAKSGEAMADGSYPIADAEDLDNAIHAVGRGNADHDTIRQHVIKRATALGLSEQIPDNWNADGSLQGASDRAHISLSGIDLEQLSARLRGALR